jgi:Tfp pilus assembly protein PilF
MDEMKKLTEEAGKSVSKPHTSKSTVPDIHTPAMVIKPQIQHFSKNTLTCSDCGTIGRTETITKGSFFIEVILWLTFLVPGIIYSIWRLTTKTIGCSACGSENIIPIHCPRGKQLLTQFGKLVAVCIALLIVSCTSVSTRGPGSEWAALTNEVESLYDKGLYDRALPLAIDALKIVDVPEYKNNSSVAISLNNLGAIYKAQGKYAEAEPLLKRAVEIEEKSLGPDHELVALSLNNLAVIYRIQGRYAEAEPLYKRELQIRENFYGPKKQPVATSLNNLALLYRDEGKYEQAEVLFKQSLEMMERTMGSYHPYVVTVLNNLADTYRKQGKYIEADKLDQQIASIPRSNQ